MKANESHPLYAGIETDTDAGSGNPIVYTCDTGYMITNSTAQWHIGSDWGGYADLPTWRAGTAVVVWEFPAADGHGGILCIGSGCYDWYAHGVDISADRYHDNVKLLTSNAFNYLSE